MRDFLVVIIVLGSVPLVLVRPQFGILLWFWLSLMNPHRLAWGYAVEFRVAVVAGVATLLAWLFSREPKLPPRTPVVYALAGFTFWVSIGVLFAIHPEISTPKWEEIIKILGMSFVAICIVQSRERIQHLLWVIAISLGIYGIKGGLFVIATGGHYRVFGPPGSFIGDNNALALALIVTLPLFQYLRTTTANKWAKLGLAVSIGLLILSILASYSRGALLGLSLTLAYMLLKSKRRLVPFVIGGGILTAGLLMAPPEWYSRMGTIENIDQDASAQGRFDAWRFAYRLALDHPLFGGGQAVGDDEQLFRHYVPTAPLNQAAHSIYFEVLGEDGFGGLALFLTLLLTSFLTASRIIRSTRDRPDLAWARSLAAMIQVSFLGYAVTGAFLSLGFFDLYYALVAVIASTDVVVRRAIAQPPLPVSNAATSRRRPVIPAMPTSAAGAAAALATAGAAGHPPPGRDML